MNRNENIFLSILEEEEAALHTGLVAIIIIGNFSPTTSKSYLIVIKTIIFALFQNSRA